MAESTEGGSSLALSDRQSDSSVVNTREDTNSMADSELEHEDQR